MAWIYLPIAGLLKIGWAISLKYTEGFTRLWPGVWTVFTMIAVFFLSNAFIGFASVHNFSDLRGNIFWVFYYYV